MSRRSHIEQTNPLRGLTPARVAALIESGMRGELAQLMWLYYIIEQSDPDLVALVERRIAAISEMDWHIAPVANQPEAEAQASALRAAYDQIENLQEAIAHLALASFRGFSICQLQDADGNPAAPGAATRIACLPHWCFVRDGLSGAFKWNPEARQAAFDAMPGEPLDPIRDRLLIRTVARPIDRVALVKFVRANFAQKAWADYIEKVAKDGVFVIEPPGVDEKAREEFRASARDAADGGGGTFPNGSSILFANQNRGLAPYEGYMRFLREQLVMAGTGGLLTMISSPTGIGQGATDAHQEAFRTIARKEAREISEVFQRFFDKALLQVRYPDKPIQAYFSLAYREETNVSALIQQAVALSSVFDLDPAEWSEKTGFRLAPKAAPAVAPHGFSLNAAPRGDKTEDGKSTREALERANETLVSEAVERALGVRRGLLKEFFADLDAAARDRTLTEPQFLDRLEKLAESLPELVGDRLEELAEIYEGLLGAGMANQIAAEMTRTTV